MPEPTAPASAPPADPSSYLAALAQTLLDQRLHASQLPPAAQQFVRDQFAGRTPTPADIDAALQRQTDLVAQLRPTPVTGFDRPLDGHISMTTPLDHAAGIIDWMFGVHGAALPPPSLRRPSQIYHALSGDFDWHGHYHADRVLFASATTTTLADLAVNALNKVMVQAWDGLGEYRWFEPLTQVQPHDGSLHNMAWISFGGIANLPVVSEGAAYTELSVTDVRETDSFVKYGGYVGVTEEMLRKDDLARIQTIPQALAVSAVRTRSSLLAAIFTTASGAGPTLDQDSVALFHANHANLATTAFSVSAWKAARLECFKTTELGSAKRLGFWPRYCLVPGDLYDDALVAFGYGSGPGGYPGTANNDTNPYAIDRPGDPRPIPVAVPDWTDTNDWAYLCDPRQQPVLQMSYAQAPGGNTHPTPEIFSVASPTAGLMFTNDVMPLKVRDWFAYGVAGYRGIGKRNVS
jgi:hypothetical protein